MSRLKAMASAGWATGARPALIQPSAMAGVYDAIRIFALEHRGCGKLRYEAHPITPEGYAVWVACGCAARLDQWVSPADAEADLRRSGLLAFEN